MSAMFVNAVATGDLTPKSFQRSSCSEEFDDYVFRAVREPFPFSPVGAASRELPELWKGRRCKIHYHDKWREAQVCSWKQYNPSPMGMITDWSLEVELDTLEAGDEVEVKLAGRVSNDSKQEGAVTMTTNNADDSNDYIIIKPEDDNMKICPRIKFHVNRMNVAGGGTLKRSNEEEDETLLSLQWLEPPTPIINLKQDVLTLACPCCRATESVTSAFEKSPTTKVQECPVCFETNECRVLQCEHGVCHGCWSRCRQAAIKRISCELGEVDEVEMKEERAKRDRLFHKKRNKDGESTSNDYSSTFAALARETTEPAGLDRLRWELLVENPSLWTSEEAVDHYSNMSMDALKVLVLTVEERWEEMVDEKKVAFALFYSSFLIGKTYAQTCNDESPAVPWADLSLLYTKCFDNGENMDQDNLAAAYLFCGQLRANSCMLTESLKYLDISARVRGADNHSSAKFREYVLNEMKEWTGTSSELTPGI